MGGNMDNISMYLIMSLIFLLIFVIGFEFGIMFEMKDCEKKMNVVWDICVSTYEKVCGEEK